MVTSPSATVTPRSFPSSAAPMAPVSVSIFVGIFVKLTRDGVGTPDLVLELEDPVEQRFGRRRATWHVNVDGHDAIASTHDRVGVMVVTTAVGARSHRDHPPRLGHLVVDFAKRRGHLLA